MKNLNARLDKNRFSLTAKNYNLYRFDGFSSPCDTILQILRDVLKFKKLTIEAKYYCNKYFHLYN